MPIRHDTAECDVCQVISDNPGLTNTQLGYLADTSERSIRRHKTPLETTPPMANVPDQFFTDIPTEIVTSRGRSILTPDGWEKITYDPKKLALAESQKTLQEDILAALAGYVSTPAPLAGTGSFAEVFAASDFQIGKACETGGGTKDTVERVMASVEAFKQRVNVSRPAAIVITDIGDVIENIWNVPSHQLSTNDLDLTEQIRVARRLYIEIIKHLAPLAPKVYVVTVPSNHGQVRNAPQSAVGSFHNDFGIEISHQLEDVFNESDLRNLVFIRPNEHQETAVLEVCGTKLAFHHGHRTKGGLNGHDSWWSAQDHGRMPGWDADILVVGHYHTLKVEHSGNGRWIIAVSASEPSSDYFALSSGKRSKRGVTCFRVSAGVWTDLEIL